MQSAAISIGSIHGVVIVPQKIAVKIGAAVEQLLSDREPIGRTGMLGTFALRRKPRTDRRHGRHSRGLFDVQRLFP
jgi:hypothetical protein